MPANHVTRFDFNTNPFSGLKATAMPQLFDSPRYSMPPACADVPEELAFYEHAQACAEKLVPAAGMRCHQIVSGNFIFGDFLEAWLRHWHIQAAELTISTYLLSRNNIDSLRGLLDTGAVLKLNLIISAGQFAHEINDTVPYLLEKLDNKEGRLQFAAAGTHCKTALIETARGNKLTIHGSANLRSSGCIEHFTLEEGAGLYDFHYAYQQRLFARYSVINHQKPLKEQKPLRRAALWGSIAEPVSSF